MIVVFEMFLLQVWASQAYKKAESRDLTDTLIRHGSHSKTRGTVATSTHDLHVSFLLTLNAQIATNVVYFSRLLKCLRSLYGKQCGPRADCSYIGAVYSGFTLFASILNLSVICSRRIQQTTFSDAFFSWRFKG